MKEELLNHENKYRAVQGVLFRNADMGKWEPEKFDRFFHFLERFYDSEKAKISVTNDKIQMMEKEMRDPECTHVEFMYRIDRWFTTDQESVFLSKKFYPRMATMMRIVIGYVKLHPTVLTQEIIDRIKDKPQFSWCLNTFKTKTTDIGAEVIEVDNVAFEGNKLVQGGAKGRNPELMMMETMVQSMSLIETILKSIDKKELMKMSVKDKIGALQKLFPVYGIMKNFKPNGNVFKQINIYSAGRDELEKAILDFGDDE